MDEQAPCYKCTDRRSIGCHSTCEDYIEWKANQDKEKLRVRNATALANLHTDYTIANFERMKRNNYRKPRKRR